MPPTRFGVRGLGAVLSLLVCSLATAPACTCGGRPSTTDSGPGTDMGPINIPDSTVLPDGTLPLDAGPGRTALCGTATCSDLATPCTFGETRCATMAADVICRCNVATEWEVIGQCNPGNPCVQNGPVASCVPGDCAIGTTVCMGSQIRFCLAGVYECPVDCTPGESCNPTLDMCSM